MHKTNGAGHIANMYVNEDVALSRPPTEVSAADLNAFQEELVNIATMNGETLLTPGTDTFSQARDAIITKIRNMINGGDYKDSVRFTTTANIVLTGLGTQAGGDWPALLTAGERIFPKNQTAGAENGIWLAAAGAWTRATDADTGAELNSGAIIPVESGTLNADTNWQLTTDGTVTIGTTALTFAKLNSDAGAVQFFAMSSAPSGWLKANGALISRASYASLFANIGTTYGVGDGATTFALPDLRGEFLRGFDDARGIDTGRAIGTWQKASLAALDIATLATQGVSTAATTQAQALLDLGYDNYNTGDYPNARLSGATAAGGAISLPGNAEITTGAARVRNIALLACIKF